MAFDAESCSWSDVFFALLVDKLFQAFCLHRNNGLVHCVTLKSAELCCVREVRLYPDTTFCGKMEKKVRVNTLKVTFKRGSKEPTDAEMFQFCREQRFKPEDIYSVHKDKELGAIMIKLKNESLMRAAIQAIQPVLSFNYSDGTTTEVTISEADNSFKYVRVFNLPPEIDDKEIHQALSPYGTIRQQVRERYHQDTGFPVFSTVRGLYMEINKEIPPQVRIRHFQARIYYDGLVNKCFICRSPDHVKQNCPRRAAPVTKTPGQGRMYSDVAAAKSLLPAFLNRSSSGTDSCQMTPLGKPVGGTKPPADKSGAQVKSAVDQGEGLTSSPSDLQMGIVETPVFRPNLEPEVIPGQAEEEDPEGKWEIQGRRGRPKKRPESLSREGDAGKKLLSAQSRRSRSRSQRRDAKGDSAANKPLETLSTSVQQPTDGQPDDQIFKKPPPPPPSPSPQPKK